MSGLSEDMLARMKQLHEKRVLSRLTAQQFFDDAMYLLERDAYNNILSDEARFYFQCAAKKGHPDARWISRVIEECNGDFVSILKWCQSSADYPQATYLVFLWSQSRMHLEYAAATGWMVAIARLHVEMANRSQIHISELTMIRDWLLKYGDRNSRCKLMPRIYYFGTDSDRYPLAVHIPNNLVLRDMCRSRCEALRFTRSHEFVSSEMLAPIRNAINARNKDTIVCLVRQHDIGEALLLAGDGIEPICRSLIASHDTHNEVPFPAIFSSCFALYAQTIEIKTRALYTTILVCKAYGCNKDMQRFIAQCVAETFASNKWIRPLERLVNGS